ncbi:MAG TPA: histidine kinase [Fulvivirga sp.]|nr:histidine kinase [Fulvivirga sp.]
MRKMFIHNGFFRLLMPPIYGVLVYLLILLINNNINQLSNLFVGQEVYVCIGLSYLLAESLRINIRLFEKYAKADLTNRIFVQLIAGVMLSLAVITIAISAYFNYIVEFAIAESQLIIFNSIFAVSSLLYNLLYFSHLYLHKQNTIRLAEEEALTDQVEMELAKFKNEANPNLLYDSLETLITLVHKSTEESEEYIDHLSAVYRYILSHRKTEFSTLQNEIKATQNVIHLLNYKHNNNISLKVNLDKQRMDAPIVPGTLPNIVEQAIRTTIINSFSPLVINIEYEPEDGYIVVQYPLNEKLDIKREQIFSDIQTTYAFYSEKPVVQVRAYNQNYIKIPLLEVIEEPLTSEPETMTP